MTAIRPLERADLPAVTALLRDHLAGWDEGAEILEATLLDHPWADPETPSLVACGEDDRLIGFIGAQPRRLRIGERSIRGVCCSHLVVDPASRGGAAGALLLGRLLKGPQELTWSDTARDVVARMWTTFGGHVDHTRACDWMLVLRPFGWARRALVAAAGRRFDRGALPVAGIPIQAAGRRLVPRAYPQAANGVTGENADASAIAEILPDASRRVELRVDYDAPVLAYTLELAETKRGPVVTRIVRDNGRPVGWYAYIPHPDVARVLHLAAASRDAEAVLGELLAHASAGGAAAVAGRFEPHLEAPLRSRLAVFGIARRPIAHTRQPELDAILGTNASLLTRLDGEWYVT